MNKKITGLIVALTLLVPTTAANAVLKNKGSVPTIAILDTGIDTSLPIFKDRIAYEVCILDWLACPNGKSFQEGTGSAVVDPKFIKSNGFEHGTQIASLFVQNNKDYNIVFVRIVGNGPTGLRKPLMEANVPRALNWVYANKDLYNIKLVSMSQGAHGTLGAAGTNYCPKNIETENVIKSLLDANIPTFFPTGNNSDYKRIDWPACISNAISIGSLDKYDQIFPTSNADLNNPSIVDFYAQGHGVGVYGPGYSYYTVTGTSFANIVAAAQWATIAQNKPSYTYSQLYDLIKKTSKNVKNSYVPSGNKINVLEAING